MVQTTRDVPGPAGASAPVRSKRKRSVGDDGDDGEGATAKAPRLDITQSNALPRVRVVARRPAPPPPPPSSPPPPTPSYPPPPPPTTAITGESLLFDFKGEVFLHGGLKENPDESDAEARRWQYFVSSPEEIVLPIFCDGSFRSVDMPSGYGLSFPRLSLSPEHRDIENGTRVVMGWQIQDSEALDSVLLEHLAVLQAIYMAKDEIEFAAMEYGRAQLATNFSPARPAVVKIYSDCIGLLDCLQSRKLSRLKFTKPHHRVRRYIVREIARASRLLHDNSASLPVKLEVHWVSAHTGRLAIHTMADKMAGEIRVTEGDPTVGWITARCGTEYRTSCPKGVITTMEDEIRRLRFEG
ncbi:hypothetical protein QBC37DRAFT_404435 [Rhypophila decipiens]|uniref:Uncharacterized protein n=1 Tax=Rhypophila decipiens TaxID=261697 RepID=A0AAN6XZ69_9PEZI|nr:hypothetical protein QBC37DRAFT_404435 [Rhypophila decipiens]